MRQNKIFIYFIIIFTGIIGFVIYSGFFSNVMGAILSTETEEKYYTDRDFNYSLQYPANFRFHKQKHAGEIQLFNYDPSVIRGGHYFNNKKVKISTYVYENPNNLSLENWFLNLPSDPDFKVTVNSIVPITVNGKQGIRVNMTDYFNIISESIFIQFKNKVLEIGVIPVSTESLEIFNKITNSLH